MRVIAPLERNDTVAQSLEKWGYVFDEWRKDRQTGGDDANVTFDVEPDPQINEGVSCIIPKNGINEEDADDGRYADACCCEEVELAVVCALRRYDGMKREQNENTV